MSPMSYDLRKAIENVDIMVHSKDFILRMPADATLLAKKLGRKLTINCMKQVMCQLTAEIYAGRDDFRCFAALLERELLRDAAAAYLDARAALNALNRDSSLTRLIERTMTTPIGETPAVLPGNRYYG